MKLLIGEMAAMIVNGSKVSSEKIRKTGFKFSFPNLKSALIDQLS
jgi:NAD dependent epimerase/dehydratase family enzyme